MVEDEEDKLDEEEEKTGTDKAQKRKETHKGSITEKERGRSKGKSK